MKVLVVSDSHGRHDLLRKAIGQEAPIDMLIHAGDVEGNLEKILGPKREYKIHKVFLTHGHHYGVSWTVANLRDAAEDCGAEVAIFGHTHRPFLEEQNDILLLNPGSVAKPRQVGYKKTYAVITIDDKSGDMKVRFKSLRGTGWS